MDKSMSEELENLKKQMQSFRESLNVSSFNNSSDSTLKLSTSFSPIHDVYTNTNTYSTQRQTLKSLKFSTSNTFSPKTPKDEKPKSFMRVSEIMSDSDSDSDDSLIKTNNRKVTFAYPSESSTPISNAKKSGTTDDDDLEGVISPASFRPRATERSLLDDDCDESFSPIRMVSPDVRRSRKTPKKVSFLDEVDSDEDEITLPHFEISEDKVEVTKVSMLSTEVGLEDSKSEQEEMKTPTKTVGTSTEDPLAGVSLYDDIYTGIDAEEIEREVKRDIEEDEPRKVIITNDDVSKIFNDLPPILSDSSDEEIDELLAYKPPIADYLPELDILNGVSVQKLEEEEEDFDDEEILKEALNQNFSSSSEEEDRSVEDTELKDEDKQEMDETEVRFNSTEDSIKVRELDEDNLSDKSLSSDSEVNNDSHSSSDEEDEIKDIIPSSSDEEDNKGTEMSLESTIDEEQFKETEVHLDSDSDNKETEMHLDSESEEKGTEMNLDSSDEDDEIRETEVRLDSDSDKEESKETELHIELSSDDEKKDDEDIDLDLEIQREINDVSSSNSSSSSSSSSENILDNFNFDEDDDVDLDEIDNLLDNLQKEINQ